MRVSWADVMSQTWSDCKKVSKVATHVKHRSSATTKRNSRASDRLCTTPQIFQICFNNISTLRLSGRVAAELSPQKKRFHAPAFILNRNSAEKTQNGSCSMIKNKVILDVPPPPRHCQALCRTPLRWKGRKSQCDSDKAQTSPRWSSPEPKAAPRSSTWLSTDASKQIQKRLRKWLQTAAGDVSDHRNTAAQ